MIVRIHAGRWLGIFIIIIYLFLSISTASAQFEFADLPSEDFPTGKIHFVYDTSFVSRRNDIREKSQKQKKLKNQKQKAAEEQLEWTTLVVTELNEDRAMKSVLARDANSPTADFRHVFYLGSNNRRDSVHVLDNKDNLSSVTRFQLDERGRRVGARKYDAADSLIAISTWQYDSADRVIGLAETGKDPYSLHEYRGEYDARGNLITTYEKSYFGEETERRNYDSLNRLITIRVFVNGKQVSMDLYEYDSSGNRSTEVSYIRQEGTSGQDTAMLQYTKKMTYDARKNLAYVVYTSPEEEEPREAYYTYVYDPQGNWTERRMLTKNNGITETGVTRRTIIYYPQ